jgi:hypothetical protein
LGQWAGAREQDLSVARIEDDVALARVDLELLLGLTREISVDDDSELLTPFLKLAFGDPFGRPVVVRGDVGDDEVRDALSIVPRLLELDELVFEGLVLRARTLVFVNQ